MNIPRIYKVSAVNEHGVAIIQDEWVPLSDYQKLEQKLKIATQCLNKIAMLQSGEMDYTNDFYEFVKVTIRKTLEELK